MFLKWQGKHLEALHLKKHKHRFQVLAELTLKIQAFCDVYAELSCQELLAVCTAESSSSEPSSPRVTIYQTDMVTL